MKRAAREWVRKAETDIRGAQRLASATERFHDLGAFHCQQSAEKYLKALLVLARLEDLHEIGAVEFPVEVRVAEIRRLLVFTRNARSAKSILLSRLISNFRSVDWARQALDES
jgi:hypothetical protein